MIKIANAITAFAVLSAASVIAILLSLSFNVDATSRLGGDVRELDPWVFTLTDSADSEPFFLRGLYVCKLDDAGGGSWGGGTVTLQKLLFGSPLSGTYVNVKTAVLVGASADIDWTEFTAGVGFYKWVVTGGTSMSVTAHCAKAY